MWTDLGSNTGEIHPEPRQGLKHYVAVWNVDTDRSTGKGLTDRWHAVAVLRTIQVKVKVKVTLVQALRLCTGRTAHRRSRGVALLFHDHGTRRGWRVSSTLRPFFTPGKDPVPLVEEAGWAPGSVWTCAENLAPTGIRSPDRPARSQSLYRLSYRAHLWTISTQDFSGYWTKRPYYVVITIENCGINWPRLVYRVDI